MRTGGVESRRYVTGEDSARCPNVSSATAVTCWVPSRSGTFVATKRPPETLAGTPSTVSARRCGSTTVPVTVTNGEPVSGSAGASIETTGASVSTVTATAWRRAGVPRGVRRARDERRVALGQRHGSGERSVRDGCRNAVHGHARKVGVRNDAGDRHGGGGELRVRRRTRDRDRRGLRVACHRERRRVGGVGEGVRCTRDEDVVALGERHARRDEMAGRTRPRARRSRSRPRGAGPRPCPRRRAP